VYWLVASRGAKPVQRRESPWARYAFLAQAIVTAILLGRHTWSGWLGAKVVPGGWTRYWIAVALTAAGLALCLWARRTLAGNWSGTVTIKVGHELVQSGPYRSVRHPIYTGILLMILGTGLASGEVHGLLAFLITLTALWLRSRVEERWMSEEFGAQYTLYREKSWALIPLVV
jgi:protein-S-isoprenylcysteine O-methyltransferase Ste14